MREDFLPTKYVYTEKQLKDAGLVDNPNMWLGDGWMWCPTCKESRLHKAMSHPGKSDCYEVCKTCKTHTGVLPIKGVE